MRVAYDPSQHVDLARELAHADVRHRCGRDGVTPRELDAIVRREEQRLAFGRVLVEVGKLLPILTARHHRSARWKRPILEAAEASIGKREPVSALGQLAFVDDVDARLALLLDDPLDGRA